MSRTFNATTTTDEVLAGQDLTGKRIMITGGASGLGAETARALAAHNAEIIIAARDMQKAKEVQARITQSTGNANIHIETLELASLAKIESFAKSFLEKYDRLDILINNAGIMACPESTTEDGIELQFGSNHIGHFYMTCLIMPALLASAKAGNAPRIVSLSSLGHGISPVVFDDIQFKNRDYDKWASYGQSKTANALFAVGLEARLAKHNIHSFAVHPGAILTPLARHMSEDDIAAMRKNIEDRGTSEVKSVEQGAATSCYAATAPELDGKGGIYLENCGIAKAANGKAYEQGSGVEDYALDPTAAEQLWQISEELVGKSFSF